jgi:uncharacterized protein YdhG (YjbR/CyaY superfamily)
MAELKTKQNDNSVEKYLHLITDEKRKQDAMVIKSLLKDVTGAEPKMWGEKIVGYGYFHYKYASGREGDWFQVGFASGKDKITIYLMAHGLEIYDDLFQKLGKHKKSKGCIYFKKLEDIDTEILKQIVEAAIKDISKFNCS